MSSQAGESQAPGLLERVGASTLAFWAELQALIRLAVAAFGILLSGKAHRANTMVQLSRIGVDGMPIAILIASSVGMVFTLQIANEFIKYGATTAIGGVVGVALSRELAPILISVVVAGRVGSAIAAELGSMKVTEQIDALEALAVDPVAYLVAPRLLACLVMVPILVGLGDVVGVGGGWIVAVQMKGLPSVQYLDSVKAFMSLGDVAKGMFKATLFGGLVALVACHRGLNTAKGAQGVGAATTGAVVSSMIAIFILNYFLSMLLFPGGGSK